jgi:outer membrane protein assembly factor BamB
MRLTFGLAIIAAAWASAADDKSTGPVDWPRLYGADDGVVRETGLNLTWKETGPPELWRMEIGVGYSQPVVSNGKLLLFHRQADKELVTCLDVKTRDKLWEFGYPTAYVDRYGYNGGPRCTPIIADGKVYMLGAEGKLHAIDFTSGEKLWSRDLVADYAVEQGFFGVGATPLLEGDRLIINVGGKTTGAGIVAVSIKDGKTLWKATSDGASYATPTAAMIHGKRHVFVLTEAGLVDVNPADGNVRWSVPFRSKLHESVNATSPLVVGDVVMVSATYGSGALALRINADGTQKQLWKARVPDSHFSNLIAVEGNVYGFLGRHESNAELFCCDLETGKIRWRVETPLGRGQLLRVGDKFIGWGERGCLAAFDVNPKDLKVTASSNPDPLKGLLRYPTWTPPIVYDGKLYLRNETTVLCLDLRSK